MAPWQLPPAGSTIVLLDARGVQQGKWTGQMSEHQREALFAALERLLKPDCKSRQRRKSPFNLPQNPPARFSSSAVRDWFTDACFSALMPSRAAISSVV